ncbi:alpha/beta hydrolase [Paenibacillus xerothermodurans]|uniref:Alpha/beta hydrolase n=1 Tax=Paenibacillus xerothermodurans TaxID=1977292 RepID=A0A2W1NAN2_PAEXE|nr:alpha/beta hydrolase [Paenibacillus xerothermodurans]PZE21457.1 alpha/beta hydrolase [Paenibacillus xerothermodurans]
MQHETFTFQDADHQLIYVHHWSPPRRRPPKAVVQIAHGMAEAARRYARFAQALIRAGYEVYANDHRGHGLTAGSLERLGNTGINGFNRMTDAMAQLTDVIRARHPDIPIYLLGHSMGSFLAQQYMYRYPDKVSGIMLSGTAGRQSPKLWFGIVLAQLIAAIHGNEHRSPLLMNLTFGSYNKAFRPTRTDADWLSRDKAEVDRYIADPYCGSTVFTAGFFRDFFRGLHEIHRRNHLKQIPKQLPVYIFAGNKDPVGGMGEGVRRLVEMYRKLGMKHVSCKLYPGGRHEMLNEINREEVIADIIAWLELFQPPLLGPN